MTSNTRTLKRKTITPALFVAGLVLVTGCSGNGGSVVSLPGSDHSGAGGPSTSVIYQFDQARVAHGDDQVPLVTMSPEGPITVRLSPDLAAAVPEGSTVAIDHYVVATTAFSTGICRLDADITYARGGQEALSIPTPDEGPRETGKPVQNVAKAIISHDHYSAQNVKVVEATPNNDAIENSSVYITADGSHLTSVHDCSKDPRETEDSFEIFFPYTAPRANQQFREYIASTHIAVTYGGGQSGGPGTTTTITGTVAADVNPAGKWVRQKS